MYPPTGHLCLVSDELEQKAPTLHAILEHLAEAREMLGTFSVERVQKQKAKRLAVRLEMSVSIQFFVGARHGRCNLMQYILD